jgi:hypothetical protein
MNIKPMDVLYMLDDEDLASMRYSDLHKLCVAITLDLQIDKEYNKELKTFLA